MLTITHIIDERKKNIPIKQKLTTIMKENTQKEYSLKQNFFDPSKSSPPNMFMLKLQMRMSVYDSFTHEEKDDSCDNK